MTQEERLLLLQDLCSRLPYGVKVFVERDKYAQATLLGVNTKQFSITFGGSNWSGTSNIEGHHIEQYKQLIKPYLRPMDSMTEEEKTYQMKLIRDIKHGANIDKLEDFYHSHYFDYRGLIPIGLALPAKDGMYNMSQPN